MLSTVATLVRILRPFLQVQFQSVAKTDRIETFPRLAEYEPQLLVIRDRAREIVDQKLWSEGCEASVHVHIVLQARAKHLIYTGNVFNRGLQTATVTARWADLGVAGTGQPTAHPQLGD